MPRLLPATIAALALAGPALAQESPRIEDQVVLEPFHTDKSLTTVKPEAEFKAQLANTSEEHMRKVDEICRTKNSPRADFCNAYELYKKK